MKVQIENQNRRYRQLRDLSPGEVFFVADSAKPDPELFIRKDGVLIEVFNLKTNACTSVGARTKVILAESATLSVVAPYVLLYKPKQTRPPIPPPPDANGEMMASREYDTVRTKTGAKIHTAECGAAHTHCGQSVGERIVTSDKELAEKGCHSCRKRGGQF